MNARTSGVYLRADPADMSVMDGHDDRQARGADRRAAGALEVDRERLISGVRHLGGRRR